MPVNFELNILQSTPMRMISLLRVHFSSNPWKNEYGGTDGDRTRDLHSDSVAF